MGQHLRVEFLKVLWYFVVFRYFSLFHWGETRVSHAKVEMMRTRRGSTSQEGARAQRTSASHSMMPKYN